MRSPPRGLPRSTRHQRRPYPRPSRRAHHILATLNPDQAKVASRSEAAACTRASGRAMSRHRRGRSTGSVRHAHPAPILHLPTTQPTRPTPHAPIPPTLPTAAYPKSQTHPTPPPTASPAQSHPRTHRLRGRWLRGDARALAHPGAASPIATREELSLVPRVLSHFQATRRVCVYLGLRLLIV